MQYFVKYHDNFLTRNFKICQDVNTTHRAKFHKYEEAEEFIKSHITDDSTLNEYSICNYFGELVGSDNVVEESEINEISSESLDIESILKDLNSVSDKINHRISFLQQRIAELDKEVVDLYHFIEFSNLNASEGYKMYKVLKDTLVQRRKAKDERDDILEYIDGNIINVEHLKNTYTSMDVRHKTERKYVARSAKYRVDSNIRKLVDKIKYS